MCCTAPLFSNKVPHNVQMALLAGLMQWSFTPPVPTFCVTVVLFYQHPGHVQPAMAARVVEQSFAMIWNLQAACSVRNLITSRCPWKQASCSGVSPHLFWQLQSSPLASVSTIIRFPTLQARCSRVSPSLFWHAVLQPCSLTRYFTMSTWPSWKAACSGVSASLF